MIENLDFTEESNDVECGPYKLQNLENAGRRTIRFQIDSPIQRSGRFRVPGQNEIPDSPRTPLTPASRIPLSTKNTDRTRTPNKNTKNTDRPRTPAYKRPPTLVIQSTTSESASASDAASTSDAASIQSVESRSTKRSRDEKDTTSEDDSIDLALHPVEPRYFLFNDFLFIFQFSAKRINRRFESDNGEFNSQAATTVKPVAENKTNHRYYIALFSIAADHSEYLSKIGYRVTVHFGPI